MTINLNLLPWREEVKERKKKEFFGMLGFCLGGAAALVLLIHMIIAKEIAFQNETNTILKNEIKILDQQIAAIEAIQKEKQKLLARMEIIQQLQTNRPKIVRLFDSIVHTIPEGLYLTNLTRKGAQLLIDGKAESNTRVSTFMRNIEASHWIRSPILSLIQANELKPDAKQQEKQVDNMIAFNLEAVVGDEELSGTKPVTTPQPGKTGNLQPNTKATPVPNQKLPIKK